MDFVFNICRDMDFTMIADTSATDRQSSAVKSAALFTDGISAKIVDTPYANDGIFGKIVDASYDSTELEEK